MLRGNSLATQARSRSPRLGADRLLEPQRQTGDSGKERNRFDQQIDPIEFSGKRIKIYQRIYTDALVDNSGCRQVLRLYP